MMWLDLYFAYSFYVNFLAANSRIILIEMKIAAYFISALVAFFYWSIEDVKLVHHQISSLT